MVLLFMCVDLDDLMKVLGIIINNLDIVVMTTYACNNADKVARVTIKMI